MTKIEKVKYRTSVSVMIPFATKDVITSYAQEVDMDNASFLREALNLYMNLLDGKLDVVYNERPHNFFSDLRSVGWEKGRPRKIEVHY